MSHDLIFWNHEVKEVHEIRVQFEFRKKLVMVTRRGPMVDTKKAGESYLTGFFILRHKLRVTCYKLVPTPRPFRYSPSSIPSATGTRCPGRIWCRRADTRVPRQWSCHIPRRGRGSRSPL